MSPCDIRLEGNPHAGIRHRRVRAPRLRRRAELLTAGHTVVGLARSDAAAAAVERLGADVRRGDLADLDLLREEATAADGVIHLAFRHDLMTTGDLPAAAAADLAALNALAACEVLVGTSGTAMLPGGGSEHDTREHGYRIDAENFVVGLAAQGVRSSVVRLPPTVHSALDRNGFIPAIVEAARRNGYAAHVGDGTNRWPAVHTLDAAVLYRLALEHAPAGSRLHGVAEECVPLADIAAAVGRTIGVPVRSISPDQADGYFGWLSGLVQLDNPATSAHTRELLGWAPAHPGLLADIDAGHYGQPG